MANTTTVSGGIIMVTGLDADWYLNLDMPGIKTTGLRLTKIVVYPSATDDVVVILNSASVAASAPIIMKEKITSLYDTRTQEFGGQDNYFPFIDISACTFGTAANARVMFHYA